MSQDETQLAFVLCLICLGLPGLFAVLIRLAMFIHGRLVRWLQARAERRQAER